MLTTKAEGNSLHAGSLPPSTPVTFRVSIVPTKRHFTLVLENKFYAPTFSEKQLIFERNLRLIFLFDLKDFPRLLVIFTETKS